jgi:tRNA pseudouridine38-40 synthase
MRLVKAVLAYEGSGFSGWQVQPRAPTVQAAVEKALERIHGHPVRVTAASRTDSGVHARGQVVHFQSDSGLSDRELGKALDYNLPGSVAVVGLRTSRAPFHARFQARSKLYRYRIFNSRRKPLFTEPDVAWFPRPLDAGRMRRAARHLVGTHDFTAFSSPNGARVRPVRTVESLTVRRAGEEVRIEVKADGFLYNMARIIVGTLLAAGTGKIRPADCGRILRSRDRRLAGPTADPKGLALVKVYYGKAA